MLSIIVLSSVFLDFHLKLAFVYVVIFARFCLNFFCIKNLFFYFLKNKFAIFFLFFGFTDFWLIGGFLIWILHKTRKNIFLHFFFDIFYGWVQQYVCKYFFFCYTHAPCMHVLRCCIALLHTLLYIFWFCFFVFSSCLV